MGHNVEQKMITIAISVTDFLHLLSNPVDILFRQIDLCENVHVVPNGTNRAAGGNDLGNELGDLILTHFGTTSNVQDEAA
jgi:hypothetical protein